MATIDSSWADTLPRLLSVGNLADVLNLSVTTVRRMVARGELHPIRISGSLRFQPEDIRALIQRGYVTSNAAE